MEKAMRESISGELINLSQVCEGTDLNLSLIF